MKHVRPDPGLPAFLPPDVAAWLITILSRIRVIRIECTAGRTRAMLFNALAAERIDSSRIAVLSERNDASNDPRSLVLNMPVFHDRGLRDLTQLLIKQTCQIAIADGPSPETAALLPDAAAAGIRVWTAGQEIEGLDDDLVIRLGSAPPQQVESVVLLGEPIYQIEHEAAWFRYHNRPCR